MKTNIGICISTCDRPDYLYRLLDSLEGCEHEICICNDGENDISSQYHVLKTDSPRSGVAINKNNGIKHLLSRDVDYIFVLEDDCYISDLSIFDLYVNASQATGIHHFNYGPGSPWNRKQDNPEIIGDLTRRMEASQTGEPCPKLIVEYGDVSISLYEHVVGMLSFFTRECLETVGLYDENYYNAWEHVDHTLQIINSNLHPPFWHFADITGSENYIHEQKDEKANTSLAKNEDTFNQQVMDGIKFFKEKNGCIPPEIRPSTTKQVKNCLREMYAERMK